MSEAHGHAVEKGTKPEGFVDSREQFYHERIRQCGPQYAGFDLMAAETALNLLYTYDVYHQISSRYLADYGLSRSALNILFLLRHGQSDGMLLRDLGDLLLVSKANITGLLDHLERKGYVVRVVDSHDRRARFARLTGKGERLLDELAPVHYRNTTELLQDLTVEEKEMLISLLKKTRSSLSAHQAFTMECKDRGYSVVRG